MEKRVVGSPCCSTAVLDAEGERGRWELDRICPGLGIAGNLGDSSFPSAFLWSADTGTLGESAKEALGIFPVTMLFDVLILLRSRGSRVSGLAVIVVGFEFLEADADPLSERAGFVSKRRGLCDSTDTGVRESRLGGEAG